MTTCETCGSRVKVVGNVTMSYEPLELALENKRLREALERMRNWAEVASHKMLDSDNWPGDLALKKAEVALSAPSSSPLADAYKRLRHAVLVFRGDGVTHYDGTGTIRPMFSALTEITKLEGGE